ncbi:MAG: DUF551 domain-containing protein [Clostridia bacterium]|nr:DUF551 domain-containing protein [Clostridia bacterium]
MSELIRREDAIKAIFREPSYTDPYNILMEVRDRINALSAASPWHRVEEKLPQSGEIVMIYDGAIGFGCHEKGVWEWIDTFESGPAEVTHWMPLPEPPKEDA